MLRGRCATHAVQQEHQRPNYDVRRWYRTARWKALRALVLLEEPTCEECWQEGHVEPNTDVHHREKHHGDMALFFDRAKLQGLCHAHHSAHTARGE